MTLHQNFSDASGHKHVTWFCFWNDSFTTFCKLSGKCLALLLVSFRKTDCEAWHSFRWSFAFLRPFLCHSPRCRWALWSAHEIWVCCSPSTSCSAWIEIPRHLVLVCSFSERRLWCRQALILLTINVSTSLYNLVLVKHTLSITKERLCFFHVPESSSKYGISSLFCWHMYEEDFGVCFDDVLHFTEE